MDFKKYKHVIWDWNGTLLDDVDICIESMNSLLSRRKMPSLTRERYHGIVDFPIRGYYERLGFDFSLESFEELSVEYIDKFDNACHSCRLQPNAVNLLEAFAAAGITQSILSACSQDTLEHITGYFNISRYFTGIIGLDNIYAHSKVQNGVQWIEKLGLSPGEVLLIGDTVHDFEVSQAVNSGCILVACGHHKRDKLEKCGAQVYDTLTDILQDVKRQLQPHQA